MTPESPETPEPSENPETPETAPSASAGLTLQFSTHSEIGLVRKNNQDSGYATSSLLVVADGMGGAAAGDLASAVAIDTIRRIETPVSSDEMLGRLTQSIDQANSRIADLVADDYALEGMGTTVTGALFDGVSLGLVHIGDSRAYLLRDGHLERLTHDHSWVQSLVDDGKISDAEAAIHPHRSLLLKVLNGQPANDPDQTTVPVQVGDRLLFCSDGLCGLVDDPDIAEGLALEDRDEALRRLVDEALAEGGIDNITVIVADVSEEDPTPGEFVLGAAAERDIPEVAPRDTSDDDDEDPDDDTVTSLAPIQGEIDDEPEDEARYDPQPPSKRRWKRPLIGLLVVLLVVGAGLGAGFAWTRTQYFVGEASTHVAIFQGVADPLPGVALSQVYEVQEVEVKNLPPYFQAKVRAGIQVDGLEGARQTVTELSEAADKCIEKRKPKPTPTPKPTPPAKSTPSAKKSPTAKSSPTSKASPQKPTSTPEPSPTPTTPAPSDDGSASQGC